MSNKNLIPTKYISEYNKAINYQNNGDFTKAIKIYKLLQTRIPDSFDINFYLATCFFAINEFLESSKLFHKLHSLYPDNKVVIKRCAVAYINLNNHLIAHEFLKRLVTIDPDDVEAWINITSTSGSLEKYEDAIYYATQALSINPKDARLYNNLGAALLSYHKYEDALICLETALVLSPNDFNASFNIGSLLDRMCKFKESVAYFEKVLAIVTPGTNDELKTKYCMSFPLLATGELARGWEYYEQGFLLPNNIGRSPTRTFTKPKWIGQKLHNEKLLIWREQGIGDEVWFFSLVNCCLGSCENIIIECSQRLLPLISRAFPDITVRCESNLIDYDFHIAAGSLCQIFRSSLSSFNYSLPYLSPDINISSIFEKKLSVFKRDLLVGITWRSGSLSTERNIHYTSLSDWQPILSIPGIKFVNLQYGDCANELANVRDIFGIDILNFDDIDLKNDLESLAAIIHNLDLVVSISSFNAAFTQALGTKLFLINHKNWTMLGQNNWPWYEKVELFCPENINAPMYSTFAQLRNNLEVEVEKKALG